MTIASTIGDSVIRLGSTGQAVRAVQQALAQLGYPLHGTGYFGVATDTAVTAFQRLAKLGPDGMVGPRTAAAIDVALSRRSAPNNGSSLASTVEIGRPLWVSAGIGLLGIHEGPGAKDNQTIIDWAKEEGGDIGKEYTHDSIPWCALFIGHILTLGGHKGTGTLWALDYAGNWPSVRLAGPAVGAIAPMTRSGGGHVICVVGKDQRGNIMGLGGNQSDQVSIVPFPLARLNHGFWWPKDASLPKAGGMASLPIIRSDGKVSVKES